MAKSHLQRWIVGSVTCAAVAAGLALGSGVAHAQDVAPADATALQSVITLTPSDDAYVDSAQTTTNFGADPALRVSSEAQTRDVLMRFDLSAFPLGTAITSATLRLAQTEASGGAPRVDLPIWQVLMQWSEDTVTFDAQPRAGNTGLFMVSPGSANVMVDADITSLVDGWVNLPDSNSNYGLQISVPTGNAAVRTFSSREGATAPQLIIDYTLPPIRICEEQTDTCPPAPGAILSVVGSPDVLVADEQGLISDTIGLAPGQQVWARWEVTGTNGGALYDTLPAAVPLATVPSIFNSNTDAYELRLAVTSAKPVWVQDLDVSAQWYVQADAAEAARLRSRIIAASNYLYSFTDGQFALGNVRVFQSYDGWPTANIHLFANNTLQPKAIIGGIVAAETPDFAPAVTVTYASGDVSIGSYWNRFGSPPNSVNIFGGTAYGEAAMADDWSLALAHEFGHYLLYHFDTYTGVDGVSDLALTKRCTGTAMGDVYRPENQNFIFEPTQWFDTCSGTEAFTRLGGRTEWQTIAGWYPWVVPPTSVVAGPVAPPTPLTTVTFVAPSSAPGAAAPDLFSLDYRDKETSSGEARAFLYQNGRLVEQGKPPKASLAVQVTGAELGDRLCVYDINDHAEAGESPRNQFACEQIAAGDATLFMTKQPAWRPEISLRQVMTDEVQLIVTATVPGPARLQVRARLYPEHQTALADVTLLRTGSVYSATVTMTQPVTALYAQVFVNEAPLLPQTRREVVADRGTGGGGAFGPAKAYGGALVVSSDGNASFAPDEDLDLLPGQSIAWQSMPGTPPLPFFKWISGQSYRLDAFPAALVENGTVRITFEDAYGAQAAESGAAAPAIYFWNGSIWGALPTTLITPAGVGDGVRLASARSQGNGVYAVLIEAPPGSATFLPAVRAGMR